MAEIKCKINESKQLDGYACYEAYLDTDDDETLWSVNIESPRFFTEEEAINNVKQQIKDVIERLKTIE